jgi:hypothetical protein
MPRPITAEPRAPASRLITVTFTRDEMIALLHVLEEAKDNARKRLANATVDRDRAYPPVHPDLLEKQRSAAGDTYQTICELLDQVSDVWAESR